MGRIGTDWITDRLPTEEDADCDGEVFVLSDRGVDFISWNHVVTLGTPWRPFAKPTEIFPTERRFAFVSRAIEPGGDHIIDAIDDDGNAWWMVAGSSEWNRLTPLPAKDG